MDRQIEILKAVVVFFDTNSTPASYKEIAPLAHMDPTVVSGTLGFWKDIGLLEGEGGKYRPSAVLTEMVMHLVQGDKDGAWRLFRKATGATWFMSHITMSFQIKNQMTLDELVDSLSAASGSSNMDRSNATSLRNLVALLEIAALVVKDSQGIYRLSPESALSKQQIIKVNEEKSLVQVRIGNELYGVEATKLKEFVKSVGNTIDPTEQQLL